METWVWCGGHEDWDEERWSSFLRRLVDIGIGGILLGGGLKEVSRVVPWAVEAGLVVHAWMWTMCRPKDEVAEKHAEWYQVSGEGVSCLDSPPYVGYYKWLCPSSREAVDYLVSEAEQLADIPGVTSVHLDYVRFPDVILAKTLQPLYSIVQDREYPRWDFCYCDRCVAGFRDATGIDVKNVPDPSEVLKWKSFRYQLVVSVVKRIQSAVREKSGRTLSAAVFPYPDLARFICRQSWDDFAVDAFFPMIYHSFYDEPISWIGQATRRGVEALRSKSRLCKLFTGLYLPAINTEKQLSEAIQEAKKNGADGVSFFDAENLKDYHVQAIRKEKAND